MAFSERLPFLLRVMQLSRECDRREGLLLRQGKGWFHVAGAGHEAQAALGLALGDDDLIFPYYRDRAIALARGLTLVEMARLFFARADGVSAGRNMPCHPSWRAGGLFSVTTPTGAQCLPAVGAAWGRKRDGRGVAVCLIGEASTRQGEFYEAICLAVQEALPVVFFVEDNGYGISTPTRTMTPKALGVFAEGVLTPVDGRDVVAVNAAVQEAVRRARAGEGPTVLWATLDRLGAHTSSDDERVYRSKEEREGRSDPIALLAESMIRSGQMTAGDWQRVQQEIAEEVRAVYRAVEDETEPAAESAGGNVLGPPAVAPSPPIVGQGAETTLREAVNAALRAGLTANPRMLLWGQDIADPKGGVFGLTRGLSIEFPDRVANAPLAEATLLGAAVGLASAGYFPVFELQFIDFLGPGFNQLVSQLSSLRWRSNGDWTCPSVFYAPCGAYLPAGGMWHSQSGEGILAHVPGIRVAMPATPAAAVGVFWTAFHLDDPTFILLPKHLLHARVSLGAPESVSVGQARVVRSGSDVTIVAWGNTVEVALAGAERAAEEGVQAEVIDLQWLIPWDREAVAQSLAKTGRLIVVQEDTETASLGQAILAAMTAHSDRFYTLAAAPRLLARPDLPMPFSPALEAALLPNAEAVAQAIREAMAG